MTILPFCALMKWAGSEAFIADWKRIVETEPDADRRINFRDWAVIMSELAGYEVDWLKHTKGWLVMESKIITSWKKEGWDEGQLELQRANLLRAIGRLCRTEVPDSIRRAVEGTSDMGKLGEWFDLALSSTTIATLRRRIKATDPVASEPA